MIDELIALPLNAHRGNKKGKKMHRDLKTKLLIFIMALSVSVLSDYPVLFCQTKSDTSIAGTWQGILETGGAKLHIAFHVGKSHDGLFKATLDSPDQSAYGIPFASVTVEGDSAHFVGASFGGTYDGKFSATRSIIVGIWKQGGGAVDLKMERSATPLAPPKIERPQEPKPPYPYKSDEVSFESELTGLRYSGTLTFSDSIGPFPAVVLITGSGVNDRNEAVFGHKPFLVIADYLTRRGIAVLRVDDRGVSGSTGEKAEATLLDRAQDVIAEIGFLKTCQGIDSDRIGLIGHSEGGMIAPIVAAKSPNVAFVVLLAGPGVPGYQVIMDQVALLAKTAGMNDSLVAIALKIQKRVLDIAMTGQDSVKAADSLRAIFGPENARSAARTNGKISRLLSPSYRSFLSYDPRPSLEKVKCPLLAIDGTLDLQVPPEKNLRAIEDALKEGGNKDYTIKLIPGLNHLFQDAKTGSLSEYAQIEETFSPEALKIIGDWIVEKTRK